MLFVLDRDGIAACPDDPLRAQTPPVNDMPDLCPELIWHGLKNAIRNEQNFLGRTPQWWKDTILDSAYFAVEEMNQFEFEEVQQYEA